RAPIGADRRARRADRRRAESSVSPTSREVATLRLRAENTLKDGLAARIRPGAALLLDSSTLIEYLYQGSPVGVVAASIVDDLVATGRNRAFVSAISATEILVRPFEQRRTEIATEIVGFLEHFPNLTVLSLDFATPIAEALRRAGLDPEKFSVAPGDAETAIANAVAGVGPAGAQVAHTFRFLRLADALRAIEQLVDADVAAHISKAADGWLVAFEAKA